MTRGARAFSRGRNSNSIKKADPSLADADFGYFDENQDGKVSRKEFVEKPSVFILRFDKNGDCRVTPEELKAATTPQPTGGPQERPRDRFHSVSDGRRWPLWTTTGTETTVGSEPDTSDSV